MDGEYYAEALEDLKKARLRRDKDQRMARTYGMHFVDYFPHRETGLAYYRLGRLKEAERELELSLKQYPSSKARFYLDRVRKRLIEQEGGIILAPFLDLDVKTYEFWTKDDPVVISGTAKDEHYIAQIKIAGTPLFLDGAQKHVSFKQKVQLAQGLHVIDVVAKNLSGKETRKEVTIHVDREGPTITIEELVEGQGKRSGHVYLKASIYDEAGVSELRINGAPVRVQAREEVIISKWVSIKDRVLELIALDTLKNKTSALIPISPAPGEGSSVMLCLSESSILPVIYAGLFDRKNKIPPKVTLRGWTKTQTVYLEKIYLEGHAEDPEGIVSLTINGKSVLRKKCKYIFFNQLVDLKEGKNIIVINATDLSGNRATEEIEVIRKIPKVQQLAERMSVSIMPFDLKGTASDISYSLQDNLISSLMAQNRFRLVERQLLDLILTEHKLSRSELIDRATALKIGKLAAAEAIIAGTIIESSKGIEIVGRMVDTETAEILAVEDVYDEVKDLPSLRNLAEGLAIKFHRDFPLAQGIVVSKGRSYIFTDLGQDKIRLKRKILVYRDKPIRHPLTGKILGNDSVILGRARIVQIGDGISKAELIEGNDAEIKQLDKVIPQ